jgi:two-component system KDP operon response regulator KdpE
VRWLKIAAGALTVAPIVTLLRLASVSYAGVAAPLLLLDVVIVAGLWGTGPALAAAASGAGAYSYFFLPPPASPSKIPQDWIEFFTFIGTAVIAGELASRAERRTAEAQAGRQEIERLYQELHGAFERASEAEAARRNEQLKAALLDALTHNLRTPLTSIKAAVTALIREGRLDPAVGADPRRPPRAAAGDRRGIGPAESVHRWARRGPIGIEPERQIQPRAVDVELVIRAGLQRAETVTRDHRLVVAIDDRLPRCRWTLRRSPKRFTSCSTTPASMRRWGRRLRSRPRVRTTAMCDHGRRRRARHPRRACGSACSRSSSACPGGSRTIRTAAASGSGCRFARRLIEAQAGRIWIEAPAVRARNDRRDHAGDRRGPGGRGTADASGARRRRSLMTRFDSSPSVAQPSMAAENDRREKDTNMMAVAAEKSRVLVVDDEPQITRVLRTVLSSQGYQVRTAAEGEAALASFAEFRPELVITDLYMPHMDGIELCRRIRALSPVPIIVLSVKGEEKTKVEALDCGADDYVTKPFGIDELLARVRAALRRSVGEPELASFDTGEFRVDLESRRVHVRGREVRLTPKEFELFVYMARHPNRVLTHRTLLEAVWGEASQEQPEYLRVFMGQLRKKLELDPSNPRFLVTEPWVGYRFNPNG